jgi:zinc and cadmium transporter
MTLFWIIAASLTVSIGIVPMAVLLFNIFKDNYDKVAYLFLSFSLGILLGSAFFDLIPHVLEEMHLKQASIYLIAGILLFWLLHKVLLHRCPHEKVAGTFILWGDAIHNLTDGVVIASAFTESVQLGFMITISVAMHELSHGIGQFAVLLDSGYSRAKALKYYALTSLTTVASALITHVFLVNIDLVIPYIFLLSAANFIYISLVELVPNLNKINTFRKNIFQFLLVFIALFIAYNISHEH